MQAGVTQVQACLNGYGERCGNANMVSVIANLKLKLGIDVVTDEQLARLTEVSHFASELANLRPNPQQPYVGVSAFAHKAGLHVAAIIEDRPARTSTSTRRPSATCERVLVSRARRAAATSSTSCASRASTIELTDAQARAVLERVKEQEARGYQYEGAEASFELLVRRTLPGYVAPFDLDDFLVVERRRHLDVRARQRERGDSEMQAEAMVKVRVGERAHPDRRRRQRPRHRPRRRRAQGARRVLPRARAACVWSTTRCASSTPAAAPTPPCAC